MDDALTPVEREVKEYLVGTLATDLAAALALLAVERPADPHMWLARALLAKSPRGAATLQAIDAAAASSSSSQ